MANIINNEMEQKALLEGVVYINRTAKVVKGGKRFSFAALVVVGDGEGSIGYGLGKANEVPEAIRKGTEKAKKNMIKVPLVHGTIPNQVIGKFGASNLLMKPAKEGTGVIAGTVLRTLFENAGIKNIVTKSIGSSNPHNLIKAAFDGLKKMRSKTDYLRARGRSPKEQ